MQNKKKYKEPLNKKTTLLKGKRSKRYITGENIQKENNHMKSYSTSYVTREMQIKTAMRYHCTPMCRMSQI
jgi:hypothetical protein